MRYLAVVMLLGMLGCSAGEEHSGGTAGNEHLLQDQQDALTKAKEAAAALDAAGRRSKKNEEAIEQDQ